MTTATPARTATQRRITWWCGCLFMIGSFLFALGSFPLYFDTVSGTVVAVTFFTGSIFFTTAGYLQLVLSCNDWAAASGPARWIAWRPHDGDWVASAVQSFGTVMFNISTFAAISTALSTQQKDRLVWAPDVYGSIAFLVSSLLAFYLVAHTVWSWLTDSVPWRIAALNLAGSLAFGISAVGAYVIPATGSYLDPRWANGGTFVGAVCFLIGAALLVPRERRPAVHP